MRKKGLPLILSESDKKMLTKIIKSRTEQAVKIERAHYLLDYAENPNIYALAKRYNTNRPKIERTVHKALLYGVETALNDFPRSGRKEVISDQARMWVCSLAISSPREFGLPQEVWTMSLLASYIKVHCEEKGYPALIHIQKGSLSRLLKENHIQPHKVRYYVESKDPDFQTKMERILLIYKKVELLQIKEENLKDSPVKMKEEPDFVIVSYDEKPGVQVLSNTTETKYPLSQHGKNNTLLRDYEYIRHGTLSILSGIDLLTGHIHMSIEEHHKSKEFIDFLKQLDEYYPKKAIIQVILDNHSIHTSKETKEYLKQNIGRFKFIFTPKHASWLNLIEVFFSKLQRCFLKFLRVKSKEELIQRLKQYIDNLNKEPVIFRWKYKMNEISYDMLFT